MHPNLLSPNSLPDNCLLCAEKCQYNCTNKFQTSVSKKYICLKGFISLSVRKETGFGSQLCWCMINEEGHSHACPVVWQVVILEVMGITEHIKVITFSSLYCCFLFIWTGSTSNCMQSFPLLVHYCVLKQLNSQLHVCFFTKVQW